MEKTLHTLAAALCLVASAAAADPPTDEGPITELKRPDACVQVPGDNRAVGTDPEVFIPSVVVQKCDCERYNLISGFRTSHNRSSAQAGSGFTTKCPAEAKRLREEFNHQN